METGTGIEQGIHGGDIYRNAVNLDFSVNINPLGIPEGIIKALHDAVSFCTCYPDMEAVQLRDALGRITGADKEDILCGNGASELFLAIVHALRPQKTVIPVPSFYGYEKAVMAGSGIVKWYCMKEENRFCLEDGILEYLTKDTSLLFLANPNNPIGNVLQMELLEKILYVCRQKDIVVVLDECFMGFTDRQETNSLIRRMKDYENLIVVSAFTKLFAIPGVRLGYLVCGNKLLRDRIKGQLSEWNLSVFAQKAGAAALSEQAYLRDSKRLVQRERVFLTEELEKLNIKVYAGEANYLFLKTDVPIYEMLLKKRILIRDCQNFRGLGKGFYRVAVKKREENKKLLQAMKEFF